jgi:UDP-N-acetylglucosamine acyltransferase
MSLIHPTAIVDKSAELAENVAVGPYTIIEASVRIGAGTTIASCARIQTGSQIGQNNKIGHGSIIGAIPQSLAFKPETPTQIHIGNDNRILEYVTLARSMKPEAPTIIGDRNYIMAFVHVGHDSNLGSDIIAVQGAQMAGHVTVGNRAMIGGSAGMHQFCRIGELAILGGMAKATMDIPPYMMADHNPAVITGLNSVGMQRAGLEQETRNLIKKAFRILYHETSLTSEALEKLKALPVRPELQKIIDFVATSERGIAGR